MSGQIDDMPPLRDVLDRYDLLAKKSLGQNFLLDLNLTAKIARQAGPLAGYDVVEIGPGPGGLTRAILAEGAERVIAIERDARCLPALQEISDYYPGKLQIISGDPVKRDGIWFGCPHVCHHVSRVNSAGFFQPNFRDRHGSGSVSKLLAAVIRLPQTT